MRSQNAPSEPGVSLKRDVITAGADSRRSLPNRVIVMAGGNPPIVGKLHYSSPSSAVRSSVSQLGRLMISKGIRLQRWNCWPRGKLWILSFRYDRWPATLTASPVSGLFPMFLVLPEKTTLPLQKKSQIWLIVWFRRNISIWCMKAIYTTLLSSLLLCKGPASNTRACWQRKLWLIMQEGRDGNFRGELKHVCAVVLEVQIPGLHRYNIDC
jgi:hypothetical protein